MSLPSYKHTGKPSLLRRSVIQRQCLICNRFRCPLRSHEYFARRLRGRQDGEIRLHQIDDEKVDPFARHPIHMTPEYEALYAQGWLRWNSDFRGPERHLFPRSRYSAILRSDWHDEALHYAVLSVIATQLSKLRTGTLDQLALDLQLKVVSAQRKALAHGQFSDARIVTALAIVSNSFASTGNGQEDLSAPLQLIAAGVEKRGGLQYLGMEGIVADNLMLGDHTRAIMYNIMPQYKMHLPPATSTTAPKPGGAYSQLLACGLISAEVEEVANSYWVLLKIYDRAAKGKGTSSEATYFAYLASVVEYRLACLNAKISDSNTLDECIILACLLSNHILLRNYGQMSPSVRSLEARFWQRFENLRSEGFFRNHNLHELEIFFACVGILSLTRKLSSVEDKAVGVLVQLRRQASPPVQEFEELCNVMESYGWAESVCLTLYVKLWNKVTRLLLIEPK